jgi:hypothetical protein
LTLFVVFLILAIYNAGCMTALQIQHYGIYPAVGKEGFAEYVSANNRAAAFPTILPGLLLLFTSIALVIFRPSFVGRDEAWFAVMLNLAPLFSTFRWQRRLQGDMAVNGYDETKVRLLIRTNWIRTISYLTLAVLCVAILLRVLPGTA